MKARARSVIKMREQDQIIEMTNDGNWIGNQIDGAKRVGDYAHN